MDQEVDIYMFLGIHWEKIIDIVLTILPWFFEQLWIWMVYRIVQVRL